MCRNEYTSARRKTFSIPILDFQPPRLEHYLTLSEEINTPLPDGAPKGILFFCGFGEGRTGTLLAAGKVIDEFNKLDTTARKQLLNLDREYTPDNYNGIFSYLNEDFKTTSFVGKIVQDLRRTEYVSALKKGISVETPAQFQTLELLQVMLAICEKLNDTPTISDEQILQVINNENFAQDTLEEFFQINHINEPQEKTIINSVKKFYSTLPRFK